MASFVWHTSHCHTIIARRTGGSPLGELARFELDADGNVTRRYMGVNYSERVH
jgi:hypothetical protein